MKKGKKERALPPPPPVESQVFSPDPKALERHALLYKDTSTYRLEKLHPNRSLPAYKPPSKQQNEFVAKSISAPLTPTKKSK